MMTRTSATANEVVSLRRVLAVLLAIVALLLLAGLTLAQERVRPLPPPVWPPRPPATLVAEVTAVEPYGPAYRAGLEVGDRIFEVNGEAVRSLPELRRLLSAAGDYARLTVQCRRTAKQTSVHVYPELGRIGVDARMVIAYPYSSRYPY